MALGERAEPEVLQRDGELEIHRWTAKAGEAEVRFVIIYGQGHGWPGGNDKLPEFLISPKTDTLNATETIWEFFKNHPRPTGIYEAQD